MVVSLGQITLKSEPTPEHKNVAGMHTSGHTAEDILKEMLEQAYDKFSLNIQNIQVIINFVENKMKFYLNMMDFRFY